MYTFFNAKGFIMNFRKYIIVIFLFSAQLFSFELFSSSLRSELSISSQNRLDSYLAKGYEEYFIVKLNTLDFTFYDATLSFGDYAYSAQKSRYDGELWEGAFVGDRFSYVNFVINNEDVVGLITVDGRNFQILSLGSGYALIVKTLPRTIDNPIQGAPAITAQAAIAGIDISAAVATSNGSVLDVMVVYSDDALAANASIESVITSAFAYTNQALANSGALFRYRVVHKANITYDESTSSSMQTDLTRLTSTTDGIMDDVHTWRNTYGADLVQLWVENANGVGGLAYVNQTVSSASYAYAFSVVWQYNGSSTIAHELGHNMGLSHDRYVSNISMDDYSDYEGYGFIDHLNDVNSIMSYTNECTALRGVACATVPYFSNPNIIRNGVVFGKAGIADGVRRMNSNRVMMAQARAATVDVNYTVDLSGSLAEESDKGITSCFIATAAYGSYLSSEVQVLRDFRDDVLLEYSWGRKFVAWYYKTSPSIASTIASSDILKSLMRWLLTPIVYMIAYPFISILLTVLLMMFIVIKRRRLAL